jgi:hypothetical protein
MFYLVDQWTSKGISSVEQCCVVRMDQPPKRVGGGEGGRHPWWNKSWRNAVLNHTCRESDLCIPRMKLRCLVPYSYIQWETSCDPKWETSRDLEWETIFPELVCLFGCSKIGRPILGIFKSLTYTWMWKLGDRTLQFCILDSHWPFICRVQYRIHSYAMQQNEQIPALWVREHWKTELQLTYKMLLASFQCLLQRFFTKRCSRNMSSSYPVSQHLYDKRYCKSNKIFFCHVLNNTGCFCEGNACTSKICFVIQTLQNPPLCSSNKFCNSVSVHCFSEHYKACEKCSSKNVTLIEIPIQLTIFHICNFCYH